MIEIIRANSPPVTDGKTDFPEEKNDLEPITKTPGDHLTFREAKLLCEAL